jgi:hypothetical protein
LAKKRIIFSDFDNQAKLTQAEFRRLTPVERLLQLRRDIERVYSKEIHQNKNKISQKRIVFNEYFSG